MKRRKRLRRSTRLERRTPLRRISSKRRVVAPERRRLVASVMRRDGGVCRAGIGGVCRGVADDVHEPLTRARGGSILDPANALAVCRPCHDWIHANPAEATALGLLRPSGGGGDLQK